MDHGVALTRYVSKNKNRIIYPKRKSEYRKVDIDAGINAMSMPGIPSGTQARVVASNPFIPPSAGGTLSMMDYLPEAARITRPGGEIVINGNPENKYFTTVPTPAQLDALGLTMKYQGNLLPEFKDMKFSRMDGSQISVGTMRSIV